MACRRLIFEQSNRTRATFGPERGRGANIGINPMRPLFKRHHQPTPPSHPPLGYPYRVVGMGAWAGKVYKPCINPMRPSLQGGWRCRHPLRHCRISAARKAACPVMTSSWVGDPSIRSSRPSGSERRDLKWKKEIPAFAGTSELLVTQFRATLSLESPSFVLVSVNHLGIQLEQQAS